jgi:mono/diheme cytochrome c family protein
MSMPRLEFLCRLARKYGVLALILVLASVLLLAGAHTTWAAESAASQCVACHTDAAKLKALTPPDPAATEEGEG